MVEPETLTLVPVVDWPPVLEQEVSEGRYPNEYGQDNGDGKLDRCWEHSVLTGNDSCAEEKEGEASS